VDYWCKRVLETPGRAIYFPFVKAGCELGQAAFTKHTIADQRMVEVSLGDLGSRAFWADGTEGPPPKAPRIRFDGQPRFNAPFA
jgi:hypothetical protein